MKKEQKNMMYMVMFYTRDHLGRKITISIDSFFMDSKDELGKYISENTEKYTKKFSSLVYNEIVMFKTLKKNQLETELVTEKEQQNENETTQARRTTRKKKTTTN